VFTISLLFLQGHHVVGQAPSSSAPGRIDLKRDGLIAPNFDPDISRSLRLRHWSLDPIYLRPSKYIPLPEGEPTPESPIDQVPPILISPPDSVSVEPTLEPPIDEIPPILISPPDSVPVEPTRGSAHSDFAT
jgi:hypothetical protein